MNVLALEPYYGGSHRAFLDGYASRSRHAWSVLTLPPHHWKWRMRHASVTFAQQVADLHARGRTWDVVLCTDMLNLPEFRGLAPRGLRDLPAVAYFHENQLTYPVRHNDERDVHFALSNLVTALAAEAVWFNSDYHRRDFLAAIPQLLRPMPDHALPGAAEAVAAKAAVHYPGIDPFPPRQMRGSGPLRILWAARWEHDKDPQTFFEALHLLSERNVAFTVSVIGECFRDVPPIFTTARRRLGARVRRWGYQETREDYRAALRESDVIVSTAKHEFFGIGVVEAVAAGCFPLLPNRLAYPEIFGPADDPRCSEFFYAGDAPSLADALARLADRLPTASLWGGDPQRGIRVAKQFTWDRLVPEMDAELQRVAERT